MVITKTGKANGIDTDALKQMMKDISESPSKGKATFRVSTCWQEGMRSTAQVASLELGGERISRDFSINSDEPAELLGTDTAANPQELLMAGLNACMMGTFVACCSMRGIELEHLEINTEGELDLRGFLGLNHAVKPGYDEISYTIHVKGNGTPQQFQDVHQTVMETSPNYWNMANRITLRADLIVE